MSDLEEWADWSQDDLNRYADDESDRAEHHRQGIGYPGRRRPCGCYGHHPIGQCPTEQREADRG